MAHAEACATGRTRARLQNYARFHFVGYALTVLIGAMGPVQFLISFEWLLVV